MKKIRGWCFKSAGNEFAKSLRMAKMLFFMMVVCLAQASAAVYAQHTTVNLKLMNVTVSQAISRLESQLGKDFFFKKEHVDVNRKIDLQLTNAGIDEIVRKLFGADYTYSIIDNMIVVFQQEEKSPQPIKVEGIVKDADGNLLPGVTVLLKGTGLGVTTDAEGRFKLTFQDTKGIVLVFSFVGMQKKEIVWKGEKMLEVVMEEEMTEIEEVVVTGIYERKKESFTGSAATFKGKQLKMVGTQNVLQGLRTLDPAFTMIENNQFGSDPNKLPDIEVRGKSSIVGFKELYGEDPNQPLFILDGFETTLKVVMDLSMDRIESLTILKDAASTAIYGAKAANGVIVIETKNPGKGKLRVSYNGSIDVTMADLSDYNLMNAREKLEFEYRAGRFKDDDPRVREEYEMRYNRIKAEVDRGVDTYWLSEPLRIGVTHRHNLYAEGGDDQMRYGIGLTYNNTQGVMKKSGNDLVGGNIDLLYRTGKFSFSNKLSLDYKRNEDPTVVFSEYAAANPYYRKRNTAGEAERWLENNSGDRYSPEYKVGNPLWNASLNSFNKGKTFTVRNNFMFEWFVLSDLRLRGRFGFSKESNEMENFLSPDHTSFEDKDKLEKGSYQNTRTENSGYEGDVTVRYGRVFEEDHQVNVVAGAYLNQNKSNTKGYTAVGFPAGGYVTPSFANTYTPDSKPDYYEQIKRSVSFYINGGYAYKNKYLVDFNIRSDGSSVFGSNKHFTSTWAFGLGWNIHNEKLLSDHTSLLNVFRLRASIGNPGNQNFGSFQTFTTYRFDNWLLNSFGTGLVVDGYGNPDLKWQKTIDKNIGLDLSMFGNRFHITLDYYNKNTDPLLALIGIPSSVGVGQMLTNVGKQLEHGLNGTIKYSPLYKPEEGKNYTISLNFKTSKAKYDKIGNKLDQFNKENKQVESRSLARYYDGGSPTALWAVRSAGIDPASGQELFIKKDGTLTELYNYEDEAEVGDSRPKIEGVFGNTLYYKGFSAGIYLRYSFGGDVFNEALYNKVENISSESLKSNQDKRALTDRWKDPGDVARFKRISLTDYSPMSSRFVMKNNYVSLESVRVGYEFKAEKIKQIGLSSLSIHAYMNDIARFSSVKSERGIDYPFARTLSFSLSAGF